MKISLSISVFSFFIYKSLLIYIHTHTHKKNSLYMCIHTQIDEVAEVKIGGFRVGWVVAGAPEVGGVGW